MLDEKGRIIVRYPVSGERSRGIKSNEAGYFSGRRSSFTDQLVKIGKKHHRM